MTPASHKPAALAKVAGLLCAAPVVGLGFTVWSLMGAFKAMSAAGTTDPGQLSGSIGGALTGTVAGAVLALVGFPLAMWCLIAKRQRPWWLIVAACFAGLILVGLLTQTAFVLTHPGQHRP